MTSAPSKDSFTNQIFTDLGKPAKGDKIFDDDYVHSAFETFKIKGTTANKSEWEYKAKVKIAKQDVQKGDTPAVKFTPTYDDELKIKFPYNDRYTFWFGARRNGDLKFHVDFGNFTLAGKKFNVFANSKFTSAFSNIRFRVGSNYFSENFESNSRIESWEKNFCLTQRILCNKNNFSFGLVGSLCLRTLTPGRFDYFFGFEKDSTKIYFKHNSDQNCSQKCDSEQKNLCCPFTSGKYLLHFQRKFKDITYGTEVSCNAKDLCCKKDGGCCGSKCPFQVVVGAWHKRGDFTFRHKLNCSFVLSHAIKYKVNNTISLTASCDLNLKKLNDVNSYKNFPPIPFGYQVDINA